MRAIKNEVPHHYMPQLQLSMEVFNLDVAHFVQYKPDGGPFDPAILDVVVVHRDRMWFEKNLPLFQKFISDLEQFKIQALNLEPSSFQTEDNKEKKKRKRKYPDCCLIEDHTR